jgi:hypothetical protein
MAPAGVRESKQQGWMVRELALCFCATFTKSRSESVRISLIQNDDDEKKTARDCSAQLTRPFDPAQPCPAILTALLD